VARLLGTGRATFRYNPGDRVLALLDERASPEAILALGANLPMGPFVRAAGVRALPELARLLRTSG